MSDFLAWMDSLPGSTLYLLLGAGAAIENVIPAVPADTFVALGGLLSAVGSLNARGVFLVTWLSNVVSALVMYRLGYTQGKVLFETRLGRFVLRPHQMERVASFYARWGLLAIFLTRFLPGVRAVVPVFAGITRQNFLPVALPLALASAIRYAALILLGRWAGANLDLLGRLLGRVQGVLGALAVVLAVVVAAWWWRSRRAPRE